MLPKLPPVNPITLNCRHLYTIKHAAIGKWWKMEWHSVVTTQTSAVTVSGLSVLSATWKSTDGTARPWKYVVDNIILYRAMYREYSVKPGRRLTSGRPVTRAYPGGVYP